MKTTKRIKLHNQKLRKFYRLQYNTKVKELKRLKWEGYIARREDSQLRCRVSLHENHNTAYSISFECVEWTSLARRCPALILVVTQKQALGSVKV